MRYLLFLALFIMAIGCLQPAVVNSREWQPEIYPTPIPALEGLATYYGPYYKYGMLMRNEQPYDPHAYTCAVDDDLWKYLAGKVLLIVRVSDGKSIECVVTDTGYFRGTRVVVDLPDGVMNQVFGLGAWEVRVYER